jgi:hypothetical protein
MEPKKRLQFHGLSARRYHSPFAIAIREHGIDNMRIVALAKIERSQAAETEARAIAVFDTFWPNGLNATPGGNGVVRTIPNSEVLRVKKMRATMATKEYKAKQRDIQSKVWTPERRATRSEAVRKLWADPAYRSGMLARRRKHVQHELKLLLDPKEARDRYHSDPEWRAKWKASLARRRAPTSEERAAIAGRQRELMADPSRRVAIALTMSKYVGCTFHEGVRDHRIAQAQHDNSCVASTSG